MNPLNVVVPFNVFTAYRDRRSRGEDAGDATSGTPAAGAVASSHLPQRTGVAAEAGDESGGVEILPASLETAVDTPALAQPVTERIPS